MTKRTRLFLLIAAGVLVAGLGTGLVASYMGLQTISLIGSDGPAELAYVPASARVIGFADVREVMNSDLRQKFREMHPQAAPDGNFENETGINVETDIDQVVVAMLAGSGENQRPLLMARGRFDATRIEGVVLERGGRLDDYKGQRLLILDETPAAAALTFAESDLAIFGHLDAVRLALDTKAGTTNITDNAELMALVRDSDDGNAWAVGRFDAITGDGRLPQGVVDQLPPINLFAASGYINGGLRATIRAEARDDAAAQNLREVVRGFVALARLQAGRNDQLLTLLNSLELTGEGKTVAFSVSIPAEALNLLTPRAAAAPRRQAGAAF